jgi:hypothetical protein
MRFQLVRGVRKRTRGELKLFGGVPVRTFGGSKC